MLITTASGDGIGVSNMISDSNTDFRFPCKVRSTSWGFVPSAMSVFVFVCCCCDNAAANTGNVRRLNHLAAEHGITSRRVDDATNVYVNGKWYEIYTGQASTTDDGNESFVNHLYAYVGCVFACWTVCSSSSNRCLCSSSEGTRASTTACPFVGQLSGGENKPFLDRQVVHRLQRFVDVQTEFLRAYWSDTDGSPPDASLIATLLTLMMTTELMDSTHNRFETSAWSDVFVVQTLLTALNSVQYYTNVNCELTTHYDNKQL